MKSPPTNVAQSVRARLLTFAKAKGEDFNYVLIRYALERFLVRLSRSAHRDTFILKGAMLFRAWAPQTHRPTKDLDLLGRGSPEPARLARFFEEICAVEVDDDGMVFDAKSVKAERIKQDAEYEGVRITLRARLGTARLDLQVDVGFGDAVSPDPVEIEFPTLLPMSAPKLRAYRRETVIAEKLHAMVDLGIANSRMKDFFDIWFLSQTFDFDGAVLADAIKSTFATRKAELPNAVPLALTDAFARDEAKQRQWKAFVTRIGADTNDSSFEDLLSTISTFLWPPLAALSANVEFARRWKARGPWREVPIPR
ncbi:MAG: nucleotidyl transferase AbiEii/AbiGii toxin family protein [Polyangiaceae bacterium]